PGWRGHDCLRHEPGGPALAQRLPRAALRSWLLRYLLDEALGEFRHAKRTPFWGDRHPIGTPALRVHTGFHEHGSRDWNAGRGDDCEDPSRVFRSRSAYQGDMPGPRRFPEGCAEGHPFGGDGVPLRTRGAAASQDWTLERQARSVADGE